MLRLPRVLSSRALPCAMTAAATCAALLAVPGLEAVASGQTTAELRSPSTAAVQPAAAQRRATTIRFLDFDHTRGWLQTAHVVGQVTAYKGGHRGALKRVHVKLYRKLDGQTRFHYLSTKSTGTRPYPRFRFATRSRGNAVYKVVFAGNSSYQRSGSTTRVLVHRSMRAGLEDGSGRFHGTVRPNWNHRVVRLEKRRCASCSWHKVRSTRSNDRGRYRFTVPAPRSGRWWWRASTPATGPFIWSYTGVFTTQLR